MCVELKYNNVKLFGSLKALVYNLRSNVTFQIKNIIGKLKDVQS